MRSKYLLVGLSVVAAVLLGVFLLGRGDDSGDIVQGNGSTTAPTTTLINVPDVTDTSMVSPTTSQGGVIVPGEVTTTPPTGDVVVNPGLTPIGKSCSSALDPARAILKKIKDHQAVAEDIQTLNGLLASAAGVCSADEWVTFQTTELVPVDLTSGTAPSLPDAETTTTTVPAPAV